MGIIGYGYGSEWQLTHYLARRRAAFTRRVEEHMGLSGIVWLDHNEYLDRDSDHLTLREPRGLNFLAPNDPVRQGWEGLWPQTGNVHNWDAVGQAGRDDTATWVLVEAKAHLGELASSCSATSTDSRRRITDILATTRADLGVSDSSDWLTGFYQYCNRLALLHYLRQRRVDARLLFIYFTGDRSDLGSHGRACPLNEDGWRAALDEQKRHAGVATTAPILRYVHELFLPAYRVPVKSDAARKASVEHP